MLIVSLGLVLFSFWLLLSGHYTALTITAGLASTAAVVALTKRMGALDKEGHPITLVPRGVFFYYPWLAKEIVLSAWNVTKLVLNPKLPISPTPGAGARQPENRRRDRNLREFDHPLRPGPSPRGCAATSCWCTRSPGKAPRSFWRAR